MQDAGVAVHAVVDHVVAEVDQDDGALGAVDSYEWVIDGARVMGLWMALAGVAGYGVLMMDAEMLSEILVDVVAVDDNSDEETAAS